MSLLEKIKSWFYPEPKVIIKTADVEYFGLFTQRDGLVVICHDRDFLEKMRWFWCFDYIGDLCEFDSENLFENPKGPSWEFHFLKTDNKKEYDRAYTIISKLAPQILTYGKNRDLSRPPIPVIKQLTEELKFVVPFQLKRLKPNKHHKGKKFYEDFDYRISLILPGEAEESITYLDLPCRQ